MLLGDSFEVGKQGAPQGRQVERVRAPVEWVASPLGEPTLLEVVDERDHSAAVDPQRSAQCLLGLALGSGEMAEHPEVPGMEVESGEAFGEAPMCVGAQLREQEADTPAQPPRRGPLHADGIPGHTADNTAPPELFLI